MLIAIQVPADPMAWVVIGDSVDLLALSPNGGAQMQIGAWQKMFHMELPATNSTP